MKKLFSHILRTLLLFSFAGLVGCQEGNVTVLPADGSRDVPVNAAIQIRYQGSAHIRGSFIQPKNFQLTKCPNLLSSKDPATQENAATEEEEKQPTEKKDDGEVPVTLRLSVRKYAPKEVTDEEGNTTKVFFTDVIAMPQAATWRDTPLEAERERYCFRFNDVKDEAGNIYRGRETSFTTEKDSNFYFAENTSVDWSHYANWETLGTNTQLSQNDRVIFKFGQAVFPPEVQEGTRVCKASDKVATNGDVCEEYGQISASHTVYQIEDFQPEKDGKYPIVRYDLYSVVGSPFDGESAGTIGALHSAYPGLGQSRNHITNLSARRFDFNVSSYLEKRIEREVLTSLDRGKAAFFSVTETEESR